MTTVDVVIASPVVVDVVAGIPMPAGAHAGSHETGGSDPITDLDAAVITSGVFDVARLPAIPPAAPLAHHVSHELGGADVVTLAQSQVTGLSSALGGKVDTTDPRLSDARPPTAHHGTHDTGGSDPITALDAAVIATGTINAARLPAVAPAAHHVSHETGGADAIAALSAGVLNTGTLANARLAPDVAVTSSVAIGTNPATTGAIRLASNASIVARNAANNADAPILGTDASNDLIVGNQTVDVLFLDSKGVINFRSAGAVMAAMYPTLLQPNTDASMDLGATNVRFRNEFLSGGLVIGTNPATTGAIRLANDAAIWMRNAANTGDVRALRVDTGNNVIVGDSTVGVTQIQLASSVSFTYNVGSFYPAPDNAEDLGRPSNRWRNVYVASSVINRTKAGTPVDADVTTPTDGMLIVDTTANKIWVRIGGVWKGATVA